MLSNNISETSFSISICTYFLGITALKPKSRQNLRKFKLFRRIFHPGSDNRCHWHLHTALWNIWWKINEPCGQFDLWLLALIALFFTSIFFFFFFCLHICFKFSSDTLIRVPSGSFFVRAKVWAKSKKDGPNENCLGQMRTVWAKWGKWRISGHKHSHILHIYKTWKRQLKTFNDF